MALHLTNPKTDKLARELSKETGESLTEAVNTALQERLDRVAKRKKADEDKFVADILKIARGAKGLRKQKKSSVELFDDLYDEDGLPR
jgi:antitoxin VapB